MNAICFCIKREPTSKCLIIKNKIKKNNRRAYNVTDTRHDSSAVSGYLNGTMLLNVAKKNQVFNCAMLTSPSFCQIHYTAV